MPEWRETTLGEVAEVNPREPPLSSEAPFITMADVQPWGTWARSASQRGSRGGVRARGGDVLMARITPCLENGKIAKIPQRLGQVGGSTEFIVLRGTERASSDFLFLWASSPKVHSAAVALMTGSTGRQRVSTPDVGDLRLHLPPLDEQRRIVNVVGAVDDHIAALDEETSRGRVLLALQRDDTPPAPSVDLGNVVDGIDSGTSVVTSGDEPAEHVPRILKVSAVRRGRFEPKQAKRLEDGQRMPLISLVREGDLLITRSNTPDRVGFCAVARSVPTHTYMPDLVWRIRVDEAMCTSAYLEHALSSSRAREEITSRATGTSASMRKINKMSLARVPVPLPSIASQEDYVRRCDAVADVVLAHEQESAGLRVFRARLLTALLSQSITIPESYDALLDATSAVSTPGAVA